MDKMCNTKQTRVIETTYDFPEALISYSYEDLKNTLNNAYWFLEGEDSNLVVFHLFSNPNTKEVEFVACNLGSDIFDCLKLNTENLISTGGYVIKDKGGKEIINPILNVFKQDVANSILGIYRDKENFNHYPLSRDKIINAIDKEIFAEYLYQKVVGYLFDGLGTSLKFFVDQFRDISKNIKEYRISERSYLPDVNGFDPILNGALLKAIGVNTTIPVEKYTYSQEDLEYYQIKERQIDWTLCINAEFCGLWNALVDTVEGFVMLLPSLYEILSDRATFKKFFRIVVDFLMMTPEELGDIITAYDFENSKGSIYKLSYQQCYEITMILTLFLPLPKIGKAGKASQALEELSVLLSNFSVKNELILLAYKMGLRVEKTAGEWKLVFGKYTLLKGQKDKILKMIEDIGEMSKFGGDKNLTKLRKQLDEAIIEENGVNRKLTEAEKEEILEKLRHQGGNSYGESIVATTVEKEVKAFEKGAKQFENTVIKNPFEKMKEAMPYFNHKSIGDAVKQIGKLNCGNTAEVVVEFLRTGKLRLAEPSGYQATDKVAIKCGGGSFQPSTIPRMKQLMYEDDIVVIYGIKEKNSITGSTTGHYFVGMKKGGELHVFDGQTGEYVIYANNEKARNFLQRNYLEFQYTKVRK